MLEERCLLKQHLNCGVCKVGIRGGFKFSETKKGEKYTFDLFGGFTLVFLLKGKAVVSCNEFIGKPVEAGEMILFPKSSSCSWISEIDTASIVLEGGGETPICDSKALREHAEKWLNVVPAFLTLPIRTRLVQLLESVKSYIEDGIDCPHMYKAKEMELSSLLRAYYTPEELMNFFMPTVCNTHEFETFVMNNYLNMKGVKEFVDLSGMNLATFKRKFKSHFKMSPYQWLIKQKSKHIYYELSATDKSFTTIARDFKFTDPSHFNRYCKTMFGATPSQIRKRYFIQ